MLKKLAALPDGGCDVADHDGRRRKPAGPVTISFYSTRQAWTTPLALLDEFMAQLTQHHRWSTIPAATISWPRGWRSTSAGTAPTVSLLDVGRIAITATICTTLIRATPEVDEPCALSGWEYRQKEGSEAIYGIPPAIRAFGLMYNKDLVAEVLGEDFDVNTVNTVESWSNSFDAFEAAGTPRDRGVQRRLGSGPHYLACQLFSEWLGDKGDPARHPQRHVHGRNQADGAGSTSTT